VRKHFIVAGGGIGGMATALALHRAGFGVTLYERSPVIKEVGAGISLWPNATRVLQSWGVLDRVAACGKEVNQFNLQSPDGAFISTIPMGGFATPALCLRRTDLHLVLRNQLPEGCVIPNRRLERFIPIRDGVVVKLSDGNEISTDGLIGSDGIHSTVRAQIHGATAPSYRGYCIWRGLAPEISGAVAGHIGETWGLGRRFGIMPVGQGRVCWYATRNCSSSRADLPEGRKAEVLSLFQDWHHPISTLINATEPAEIIKNDAQDRKPLHQWGIGRVTLLGDAAHPVTPNVGQGACLALEDAACLAKCLLADPDIAAAFRTYEARRGPRTAYVARQARRIGFIGQWENPWMAKIRNLATRVVLARSPDMQLNALYAYEV
jgi:2-polyprenyl-6-methoxyphenol hydroxylase-like FAD-dependent oxidoreductase